MLERIKKAEEYLDNKDITMNVRERWIPKYQELVAQYNKCLNALVETPQPLIEIL